jgi:hypothetical protein
MLTAAAGEADAPPPFLPANGPLNVTGEECQNATAGLTVLDRRV